MEFGKMIIRSDGWYVVIVHKIKKYQNPMLYINVCGRIWEVNIGYVSLILVITM